MDGLTDNEHGHPDYLKLEPRDRALVRAILMTALRHRRTIQAMRPVRLRAEVMASPARPGPWWVRMATVMAVPNTISAPTNSNRTDSQRLEDTSGQYARLDALTSPC